MPGFYDYGAGASTGAATVAPRITAELTDKAAGALGAGSLIVGTLGVALVAALTLPLPLPLTLTLTPTLTPTLNP